MQFLRKVALASAASLLSITLFSFGFSWSLHQTLHTPQYIKQALAQSGIYKNAVPELLKQKQKDQAQEGTPAAEQGASQSGNAGESTVPTNDPAVRQIIEQSFPPQYLQSQVEQVLDASYGWLQGKTPELQFTIQLDEAKTKLADGLQQYAQTRLNSLPACAPNEIPSGDVDPFNATCVPGGVDKNALAAKASQQIRDGDFLKDATVNADTIKTKDGKTLSQQLKNAPKAYHASVLAVYGSAFLAALLAVGVVFLSATWRSGLRRVGATLLTVGAISTALALLSNIGIHRAVQKIAHTANQPFQPQVISLVRQLADTLRNWWVVYSVVLLILGVAALLALHLTKPKEVIDLNATAGLPKAKKHGDAPELVPDDAPRQRKPRHEHVVEPPKPRNPIHD